MKNDLFPCNGLFHSCGVITCNVFIFYYIMWSLESGVCDILANLYRLI